MARIDRSPIQFFLLIPTLKITNLLFYREATKSKFTIYQEHCQVVYDLQYYKYSRVPTKNGNKIYILYRSFKGAPCTHRSMESRQLNDAIIMGENHENIA